MMDDISLALVCVVSVLVGIHLGYNLALAKKAGRLESDNEADTKEEANKRGIYVEEHQNKLFAYDINTHQFLCSFTNYKDLHNSLTAIDAKSSWVFYEDSRVIIESYMRRHDGANNPI